MSLWPFNMRKTTSGSKGVNSIEDQSMPDAGRVQVVQTLTRNSIHCGWHFASDLSKVDHG